MDLTLRFLVNSSSGFLLVGNEFVTVALKETLLALMLIPSLRLSRKQLVLPFYHLVSTLTGILRIIQLRAERKAM
jgi:hypothetical protein